jgi:hypothetical protein
MAAAPAERPLSRVGLLATLLGLIAVVGCLSVVRERTYYPTSYYKFDSGISYGGFDLQLATMALGIMLLQVAPVRFARAIVIADGALCLAAYGRDGLFFAAALALWFVAMEIPFPKRVRPLVPIALLTATGLAGGRWLTDTSCLFSTMFSARLMMYAWDKWQRGWPRGAAGEFLLYFMSPPLIVFPPFLVFIPFYEKHAATFAPRLTAERTRLAMGHVGTGLCAHFLLEIVRWHSVNVHGWLTTRYVGYVMMILGIARLAHVAYGLLLLHGFIDRAPIRAPLLGTDLVEMWNRLSSHQKDMQVSLFYAPTIIRLRRKNRYVAIVAATALTLLVGNLVIHFLSRYIYGLEGFASRLVPLYAFFFVGFVAIAATLCLQEWRRRTKRQPPRGVLGLAYTVVCWAATQTVLAVLFYL